MIRSIVSLGRRPATWLALAGAVALPACGGDDGGMERRYSVTGTVNYKGEPVPHGEIAFAPVDPSKGRGASGMIEDGAYTLTTITERDGAIPGMYRVAVTALDVDTAKIKASGPGRSAVNPSLVAKLNRQAKHLTPKKYESSQSSPLTAEVKPQSNSFTFDLAD